MRQHWWTGSWGLAVAAAILGNGLPAIAQEAEPFMRVVDSDDGMQSALETAIRTYRPRAGNGPVVHLVAAIHIGDAGFYHTLQAILDAQDLVLFEGVGAHGEGGVDPSRDVVRASVTRARAEYLASILARTGDDADALPASLDDLVQNDESRAALLESLRHDAWDRPFTLGSVEGADGRTTVYIASLGADGKPGGEGLDADIVVSPSFLPDPPTPGPRGQGIQQQLADALGLTFQLSGMNSDPPNWRNSDMSVEQVMQRMEEIGVEGEGEMLFSVLAGEGILGKLAGFALKLVGSSPVLRETVKMMLIDTLARADELMAIQPGAMAKLMIVILEDRNAVVLEDVRSVIENEPDVQTLAVIYGAGHLASLERSLIDEFGYEPVGTIWVAAMRADLGVLGVSPSRARMLRDLVRSSIDAQLRRAKRSSR